MTSRVLVVVELLVVLLVVACTVDEEKAPYGVIPEAARGLSEAIHGQVKVIQLSDGRCAVDTTSPGSKERMVVTQSLAGGLSQTLVNPSIADENPSESVCRNVFTPVRQQAFLPVGFSTSSGPAITGFLGGMVLFACADWGVGLIRNGSGLVNAAAKQTALRVPERGVAEMLPGALRTGRITLTEVEDWMARGLLTREAGSVMKEEIRAGRSVFFETDATFAARYLRTALQESDGLLVPVGGRMVRLTRGGGATASREALSEATGPVRLGRVIFQENTAVTLEWVPRVGKADLHFTANDLQALLQREARWAGDTGIARQAQQLRQGLVEQLRPRGYCGIQIDGELDALSEAARGAYQRVAAGDASWARFQRGNFWEAGNPADWQAWVNSPTRTAAQREVEQAVRRQGEISPQVIDGVWRYVDTLESSRVPVAPRVIVQSRAATSSSANVAVPKVPEMLPPPQQPVALLAAGRQAQAPLLLTAGDSVLVPISTFIRQKVPTAAEFVPVVK